MRNGAIVAGLLTMSMVASACGAPRLASSPQSSQAQQIEMIVRDAIQAASLKAVIVQVTDGDTVVTSQAFGETLNGVSATTDMRFRNGAVAFAYLATLLMLYVDEGRVKLDDTIDRWMPTLREADNVTLKMLANHTSGYPDYETSATFNNAFYADPFQSWGFEERLRIAFERPMVFPPGTGWSYAHTNMMILGEVLARIGGKPLDELLREKVLGPMGLTHTTATDTGDIPPPVLHAFSSERRQALGIPNGRPFYEESTFWNADWGTPPGANQSTTIADMATSARAVGTGKLLSPLSYQAMTGPNLLGFGQRQDNCAPSCFTQVEAYNYGLGVVRSGDWILQNPLLGGYAATMAYLPSQDIGVSVAVTFAPGAFDCEGNYPNASDTIFRSIGRYLAPDDAPPTVPPFTKAC